MTEDVHLLLGPYVLGGLSVTDRRVFEAHLPGCERCRDELAEAAPLPALLRRVPGIPGPPERETTLPPELLEAARRQRRSRRTARLVATAAAVCVAAGIGVGGATAYLHEGSGDQGRSVALNAATGQSVHGRAEVEGKPWGTSVTLTLTDLPDTGTFTLRATDDRGRTESAATWGATANGQASLSGATAIPMDHLASLTVLDATGSVIADAGV